MFKKLRTAVYHVQDLAAAKAWYTEATGVTPYFDEPFYAGFNINGFELGLDPDNTGITPGNQCYPFWSVDNIDESLRKLTSIGGEITQSKTNVGGPTFVATVRDPFGNYIGLIEGAD